MVVVVVDHISAVHEGELPLLEDMAQLRVSRVDQLHGFQLGFVAYSVDIASPLLATPRL